MRTLTTTQEDYLRAIYYLGNGKPIKPVEISRFMNLTKQTVTERLQSLTKQELVIAHKYGNVELTEKGKEKAKELTRNHRVIEVFLYEVLKIPKSQVHEEAHRLEHAFSNKSIRALKKFLGNPKQDPHGQTI